MGWKYCQVMLIYSERPALSKGWSTKYFFTTFDVVERALVSLSKSSFLGSIFSQCCSLRNISRGKSTVCCTLQGACFSFVLDLLSHLQRPCPSDALWHNFTKYWGRRYCFNRKHCWLPHHCFQTKILVVATCEGDCTSRLDFLRWVLAIATTHPTLTHTSMSEGWVGGSDY